MSYLKIIGLLKELIAGPDTVWICSSATIFTTKLARSRKRIMQYHSAMPTEQVFTWEEMGNMFVWASISLCIP